MIKNIVSSYVFLPPDSNYDFSAPNCVILETASKKKIPAFYLKSDDPRESRTFIYSHGNATDAGEVYPFLQLLQAKTGFNVLHYEYLGYGPTRFSEKPSEEGVYESAEAGMNFLLNCACIREEDIIVFGTSLGSGPSTYLASKYSRVKGLILETPFLSIARIVGGGSFISQFVFDMFPNVDRIEKVLCPVFIIHGTADTVVPCDHGRALQEKVRNKYDPCFVEGAGHNDIKKTLSISKYITKLTDFLEFLEKHKSALPSFLPNEETPNYRSRQAQIAFSIDSDEPRSNNNNNNDSFDDDD